MGYDDRYGNDERSRGRDRDQWRGPGGGDRDRHGGDDRGFFGRAGEAVGSWFGGGDDRDEGRDYGRQGGQDHDRSYGRERSQGNQAEYYRGSERGQNRGSWGGGSDYRGNDRGGGRYEEQGQYGGGGDRGRGREEDRHYAGGGSGGGFGGGSGGGQGSSYGTVGVGSGSDQDSHSIGGLGVAPEFSGGPRFDRQDIGWTGSHGVHPVSSAFGDAQRDPMGAEGPGGGISGGSSARSRAILQQAEQHGGRGRIEPGEQVNQGQSRQGYGQQQGQSYGQQSGQRYGQSGQHYGASGQNYAQGGGSTHDPHYSEWRRRQVEALDNDYHEYRQENASRFESEFGSWREKRGQQRQHMGRVTEHMEVVGSDGQHVGKVDKVADGRIILAKDDPNAGGHHHSIPCSWLETVDDKVTLNKSAEDAMRAWRDEETSRALNEDRNSGSGGPHMLERSFSGTYKDDDR